MKFLRIWLIGVFIFPLLFFSCIEDGYSWDDLNTEGVLKIPPIPLGSYQETFFKDLDFDEFEIPGTSSTFVIQYEDTLKNIFSADVVKDFFHKYMERNISIEGELDMNVFSENSDLEIELDYNVLDEDSRIINEIEIEGAMSIKNNETQALSIVFPKEIGQYGQISRHLLIKIRIKSSGRIGIDPEESSMQLKNLVIKTSGYFVDL